MSENTLLKLSNVSALANNKQLLCACDLDVKSGEVLALLGPNGAGKTSLLKAIGGELRSTGSIVYRGLQLRQLDRIERARTIAVMPQRTVLNFAFPVRDVIAMGRIPHCTGNKIDTKIVDEVAGALELTSLLDKHYTRLSGGEQQRVQLARCLAQVWRAHDASNRLVLLDEPTASLDLKHQIRVMRLLRDLAADGLAVVVAMHDLNLALQYTDRSALLQAGKIIEVGLSADVINAERVLELYEVDVDVHRSASLGRPTLILK